MRAFHAFAFLGGVSGAVCACTAITGLNDFSTGVCVGVCADSGQGASAEAQGVPDSSGYDPATDATPPEDTAAPGDDGTPGTSLEASDLGEASTSSGGGSGSGGSSSGGSGSGGSSGSTCVASHCPQTCIPVYQTACCKSATTCGCMVIIPSRGSCM